MMLRYVIVKTIVLVGLTGLLKTGCSGETRLVLLFIISIITIMCSGSTTLRQPYASMLFGDYVKGSGYVDMLFGDYVKGSGYVDMLQEAESKPEQPKAAEKPTFEDDFFDSISSDATGTPAAICPPAKLPFALQQSCLLPFSKVAFCPSAKLPSALQQSCLLPSSKVAFCPPIKLPFALQQTSVRQNFPDLSKQLYGSLEQHTPGCYCLSICVTACVRSHSLASLVKHRCTDALNSHALSKLSFSYENLDPKMKSA